MDIIAITVSVNYDDILKHLIGQNAQFFKEWVIVTSPDDTATKKLIDDSCLPHITTLYFDKFKYNAVFNKGGALHFAQEYVYNKYDTTSAILILDSDISLPDNFKEIVSGFTLEDDTIYGVSKRVDYHTIEDFLGKKNGHNYNKRIVYKDIVGFFQLYKLDPKYIYTNSFSCAACDIIFSRLFPNIKYVELPIIHLGKEEINWNGRDKEVDNIYTNKCKSPQCAYLISTIINITIRKKIGPYCCHACRTKTGFHGKHCQKILKSIAQDTVESVQDTVESVRDTIESVTNTIESVQDTVDVALTTKRT